MQVFSHRSLLCSILLLCVHTHTHTHTLALYTQELEGKVEYKHEALLRCEAWQQARGNRWCIEAETCLCGVAARASVVRLPLIAKVFTHSSKASLASTHFQYGVLSEKSRASLVFPKREPACLVNTAQQRPTPFSLSFL